MNYTLFTALLNLGLFIGMLVLLEVGRRNGVRRKIPRAHGPALAPSKVRC